MPPLYLFGPSQVYLFLGFVFIYFYVRLAYIHTSFMRGYDMARKKKGSGKAAGEGAGGNGAGGSKAAAAARKKK